MCVNCMSMYLYITGTYGYLLVCTDSRVLLESERRHIVDNELWEVMLGVLNEYMVVPKHTNIGPLPRTVHNVLVHTWFICTGKWWCLKSN